MDTTIFTQYMIAYYNDYWEFLNTSLKTADAFIAGGAVLAAYTDGRINDLDIYIHASKAVAFVNAITSNDVYIMSTRDNYLRPSYDQSFFRKNKILGRFSFRQEWEISADHPAVTSRAKAIDYHVIFPDIDIMIIPDEIPILNVITNFDLTFCEIWYDSRKEEVHAVDPAGIFNKTGLLKKEYTEKLLLDFNSFTVKRLQKYMNKGFSITYETEKASITLRKEPKSVVSPEEWVVYKLYNWIVISAREMTNDDRYNRRESLEIMCKYPMSNYTLRDFKRILPNLIRKTLNPSFLERVINIKQLYMKLLIQAGAKHYPPEYLTHIEDTLDITLDDLNDFEESENYIWYNNTYRPIGGHGPFQSEINAFKFEEFDIDERLIKIGTCFDFLEADQVDIEDYLNEPETFVLINKGSVDGDLDTICYSKDMIRTIISDKTQWFYECIGGEQSYRWLLDGQGHRTGNFDKSMGEFGDTPYIRMAIDSEGMNGFIPLIQLEKLLQSKHKIYYIDTGNFISHSTNYEHSWQRIHGGPVVGTLSANHCQHGSAIMTYNLKICKDPEKCIKSLSTKIQERARMFEFENYPPNEESGDIIELTDDQIQDIIRMQRYGGRDTSLLYMQTQYGNDFILKLTCEIGCVDDIPVINIPIEFFKIIIGVKLLLEIRVHRDREGNIEVCRNKVLNLINQTIALSPNILSIRVDFANYEIDLTYFDRFKTAILRSIDHIYAIALINVKKLPFNPFLLLVEQIPNLTELSLIRCDMNSDIFSQDDLTIALQYIERFEMSGLCSLDTFSAVEYFWESLRHSTSLNSLTLKNNNLFSISEEQQETYNGLINLSTNTPLAYLDLSYNDFLRDQDNNMGLFCTILRRNIFLTSLNLKATGIDPKSLNEMLEEPSLNRVTYLDISSNPRLRESHFEQIRQTLPNLTTLITD
jgi:hypothetical protein